MVNPLVTVLMTVYDSALDQLQVAIRSVLAQTLRDFELLIINDGGRDERVRAQLESWALADTRVRVYDEPHRGVAGSSNRGLELARGEFVARHDSDDWSEPERLALQVALLIEHPEITLVGADTYGHSSDGKPLWRLRLPRAQDELSKALWKRNPFVHGSTMFRRETAIKIGGYREQFPCSEDYDFLWRLTEAGGAVNLDTVLYHYRYTNGSISAGRALDQARAHRATQLLAAMRQRGEVEDVPVALRSVDTASSAIRASLKQADHLMLAGNFAAAGRAYGKVLHAHPLSGLAWAKVSRLGLFRAIPLAREVCFRRSPSVTMPALPGPLPPATVPRVMFVVPGDGQGSSMVFVRRQAESIASERVAVHFFYLGSRTSPSKVFAEFRRFRLELARLRPAVVHAHFGTVTALFAALASGSLPLVITYRGSDLNPAPESYRWPDRARAWLGRMFSQLAALRAQRIVCVSQQLRLRLWWRRGRVTILPSGVDPEVFRPEPRLEARLRLGWSGADLVALFNAGRDPLVKRLDLAQAAVDRAQLEVPDLRLEILDGSVEPALLPEMMNAADCLLVTSIFEGSPTMVQEALACNLPIVSVAVGDIAERLAGVRDSTVAASNAAALADAIRHVVAPPRRSNGRLKVGEFSSRRIALHLKEIYMDLAGH